MNREYNKRILAIAHDAYPDSLVPLSYEDAEAQLRAGKEGDTLAIFVAIECCELADGATSMKEALVWAADGMERAAAELLRVSEALSTAAAGMMGGKS